MKRVVLFFAIFCNIIIYGCSNNQKKGTIQFIPLSENDFNYPADTSFAIPKGKIWDERKRIHDSCMGSSFAANAIFIRTKDTFRLGSIVNRKTMQVVTELRLQDDRNGRLASVFNFITKPCYEKRPVHISIDSFLNKKLDLKIDGAGENINRQLMHAMSGSINTEIETGSWFNVELTDALGKILDTTSDVSKLEYKKYLLEPDNMILVRSASITDITFYIHTKNPISNQLQTILKQKPSATVENSNRKAQLFLISNNSIGITLNDFFQVMGQFMKCELK
jgi:hypothetical protein